MLAWKKLLRKVVVKMQNSAIMLAWKNSVRKVAVKMHKYYVM